MWESYRTASDDLSNSLPVLWCLQNGSQEPAPSSPRQTAAYIQGEVYSVQGRAYQWGHVHTMQELPSFLDEELHRLRQWTCERKTPVGLDVSYSTWTVYAIHITVGPYSMCSSYTLTWCHNQLLLSVLAKADTDITQVSYRDGSTHTITMQMI